MFQHYLIETYQKLSKSLDMVDEKIKVPRLKTNDILSILKTSLIIFRGEPTVVRIEGNFNVIGDLHGNLRDLLRLLSETGFASSNSGYVFLGDYVDRGAFSVEVMTLLLCLKIKYPKKVYLLRGNHEFIQVNSDYGFRDQVLAQYNEYIFNLFNEVFSYMPLAAIVNKFYFLMHGGLSPELRSIEQLDTIRKPIVDFTGEKNSEIITGIVWSDPNESIQWFMENPRGRGYLYGVQAVRQFLVDNNLKYIIRSHECVNGVKKLSQCNVITVFSTSYYVPPPTNSCATLEIVHGAGLIPHVLEPRMSIKVDDVEFETFEPNQPVSVLQRKLSLQNRFQIQLKNVAYNVKVQKLRNSYLCQKNI